MAHRAITNLDELKTLTAGAGREVSIALGDGSIFSVKQISFNPRTKRFKVFHEIDGVTESLTAEELYTKSTIGEALDKSALMVAA
jgi:hypothetical protein